MGNLRQTTVDTYNASAKELAEYFKGIGPRTSDIKLGFKLADNPVNAKVVEIGCGDGRDAVEILKLTKNYLGFDISESFIEIAKHIAPQGKFVVADATKFNFGKDLDIVFAFASLLHLDKNEISTVCRNVHNALRKGGIFYISVKSASQYRQEVKKDNFGTRLFYFYNDKLIVELAGDGFEAIWSQYKIKGNTEWLEIALRKKG